MNLKIKNYDLGVKILIPEMKHDDRGFVSEVFRADWIEFLICCDYNYRFVIPYEESKHLDDFSNWNLINSKCSIND